MDGWRYMENESFCCFIRKIERETRNSNFFLYIIFTELPNKGQVRLGKIAEQVGIKMILFSYFSFMKFHYFSKIVIHLQYHFLLETKKSSEE